MCLSRMFNKMMEERKKKIFISPRDIGEDCHTSSNIGRIWSSQTIDWSRSIEKDNGLLRISSAVLMDEIFLFLSDHCSTKDWRDSLSIDHQQFQIHLHSINADQESGNNTFWSLSSSLGSRHWDESISSDGILSWKKDKCARRSVVHWSVRFSWAKALFGWQTIISMVPQLEYGQDLIQISNEMIEKSEKAKVMEQIEQVNVKKTRLFHWANLQRVLMKKNWRKIEYRSEENSIPMESTESSLSTATGTRKSPQRDAKNGIDQFQHNDLHGNLSWSRQNFLIVVQVQIPFEENALNRRSDPRLAMTGIEKGHRRSLEDSFWSDQFNDRSLKRIPIQDEDEDWSAYLPNSSSCAFLCQLLVLRICSTEMNKRIFSHFPRPHRRTSNVERWRWVKRSRRIAEISSSLNNRMMIVVCSATTIFFFVWKLPSFPSLFSLQRRDIRWTIDLRLREHFIDQRRKTPWRKRWQMLDPMSHMVDGVNSFEWEIVSTTNSSSRSPSEIDSDQIRPFRQPPQPVLAVMNTICLMFHRKAEWVCTRPC